MKIFYNADDFGITYEQSQTIVECFHFGILNSLSIIPNSKHLKKSYELIRPYVDDCKIRCAVHLNLVEGFCITRKGPSVIPHLVDKTGMLKSKFWKMCLYNYSPKRLQIKEEIKKELKAQIDCYMNLTHQKKITIDSHRHLHVIPIVSEALMEIIEENNYELEYLRIPVDPILPLLCNVKYFFCVSLLSYIKWIVLKFFCKQNKSFFSQKKVSTVFFGIPFTGKMTISKVEKLLPAYISYAKENNKDLELMFHPGKMLKKDDVLDPRNKKNVKYYRSKYRNKEYETLCNLKKE